MTLFFTNGITSTFLSIAEQYRALQPDNRPVNLGQNTPSRSQSSTQSTREQDYMQLQHYGNYEMPDQKE